MIGVRRSRPNAFGAQLHPGRRLAALVLGAVDERERPLDDVGVELLEQLLARAVELDVRLEHRVERVVRRDRVLVALVRPQLGARRALDRRRRDELAPARSLRWRASRKTSVLKTSLSSENPPTMSPYSVE